MIFFQEMGKDKMKAHYQYAGRVKKVFHWIVCWKWYGVHIPAGKVIAIINGVGDGGGDVSITQGQMWTWPKKKKRGSLQIVEL